MSRKVIGLDIRRDAIAAVLVKNSMKGNWIESHLYVPISEQPPSEEETGKNGLADALETITQRMDTGGAVCVAAFPADQISYRNIQIPFKDHKKIRQILPLELEPTLPFPIDELLVDFHPIKLPDSGDHTDIIAAAVEISELKSCLDALISAKMDPEFMTVGGYPAALCLAKFSNIPENCLFADIDVSKCTAFIIIAGQICLVRSFPISSTDERTQSLCTDIQRTLSAFEEIFHLGMNFQPDEIHVTGYGLDDSGFEQDAERILGIPVRRAELIKDTQATVRRDPTTAMKTSAQMDNAYALALTEIEGITGLNFRRGLFAPRRQWEELRPSITKTGILMGMMLISIFLSMMADSYFLEKKMARVDKQITDIFKATFPEITKVVAPLQQMQVAMEDVKKKAFFPGDTEKDIRKIDILNELSKRIPKEIDVVFTRLVTAPESIQISGNTDTHNSVDDIKNKLEKSDIFKEVTIISSSAEKRGNRVRFKLKIRYPS